MNYNTVDELWKYTIKSLLASNNTSSRIGPTKEIIRFTAQLNTLNHTFLLNKRRKLSPAYACSEILWYFTNTQDIEMIAAYAPQYTEFSENGFAHGAYGYRIWNNTYANQFELLIEHLRQMPNSRQAIVTMWNAHDLWHSTRDKKGDIPCTLSLQFLIRDGKLHLINTMRSNDAWLGLPYDIFAFTCFQKLIANTLNIPTGTYTHQVGSMHLYEKNWGAASEARHPKYHKHQFNLCHNWEQQPIKEWFQDIQQAVVCETVFRTGRKHIIFPQSLMLRDLTICCANKWIENYHIKPTSTILQNALERTK